MRNDNFSEAHQQTPYCLLSLENPTSFCLLYRLKGRKDLALLKSVMRSSLSSFLLFQEGFSNILQDKNLVLKKEHLTETPALPYPTQQQFSQKNIAFHYTANYSNTGLLLSPQPDKKGNKLPQQNILIFIYSIYNHNWRNIITTSVYIYITRIASNEIFSPSKKIHREVGRAKDLHAGVDGGYVDTRIGQGAVQKKKVLCCCL